MHYRNIALLLVFIFAVPLVQAQTSADCSNCISQGGQWCTGDINHNPANWCRTASDDPCYGSEVSTCSTTPTTNPTPSTKTCDSCLAAGGKWCVKRSASVLPQTACAPSGKTCPVDYDTYNSCSQFISLCEEACSMKMINTAGMSLGAPIALCSSYSPSAIQSIIQQADSTVTFLQTPQLLNDPGYCSTADEKCYCAILQSSPTQDNWSTSKGTHWPLPGYYESNPPKTNTTDVNCTTATDITLSAMLNYGTQSGTSVSLVAGGQPITVTGEIIKMSYICNGYQYECQSYQEYSCEYKKHAFYQEVAYRNCPTGTKQIHAEGEYSETCYSCILGFASKVVAIALKYIENIDIDPTVLDLSQRILVVTDNPQCIGQAPTNCNILENNNIDCWSVCGNDFKTTVSASPTCGGVGVTSYKQLPYVCSAQSCGGYGNHLVTIEVRQGTTTIISDTTMTDGDGHFSYTFTTPDIDATVSVTARALV